MAKGVQGNVVLVAIFNSTADAVAVEDRIAQLGQQGYINLSDVAVASKDADGKVHINDLADEKKKGWGTGAIVGGVVGLIFPPSIIVGAAVGAGAGGLFHHFRDKGVKNDDLTAIGEQLQPGQAALIAVAQSQYVDQVTQGFIGYAELDSYSLDPDTGVLVAISA